MNQTNFKSLLRHMVYAAVCLALCMVLPFLTGQIPAGRLPLRPLVGHGGRLRSADAAPRLDGDAPADHRHCHEL